MSAVVEFSERGEDLARLAEGLARSTSGKFDGPAAVVLATLVAYAEAGAAAFAALSASRDMTEEQRAVLARIASGFRDILGVVATHFAGGDTVVSMAALGAEPNLIRPRLAEFFGDAVEPLVTVSGAAQQAMEVLRRDPIELLTVAPVDLLGLLAVAAAGVAVRQP